ncbi:hypothetical protein M514_07537 [Trichuris suis]|uniref:Uncharacterized protein n=1 Tax=Trichuris suis TaxID=68888 RepID=A0A085M362_9BILA|nr:hypothetical protein M513_07537 [Trichuris suis]KFD67804.1 hypothetical protein M514_07537 [Trichuris suis]
MFAFVFQQPLYTLSNFDNNTVIAAYIRKEVKNDLAERENLKRNACATTNKRDHHHLLKLAEYSISSTSLDTSFGRVKTRAAIYSKCATSTGITVYHGSPIYQSYPMKKRSRLLLRDVFG